MADLITQASADRQERRKGPGRHWRRHLRVVALIANVLLRLTLIGWRGWWMPMTLGVPAIVPPLLAVMALAVDRRR